MDLRYHYEKAYLAVSGLPCEWRLYLKPKPYALYRMPGKDWWPDSPDFKILPAPPRLPSPDLDGFRSDIPETFVRIIEPFPSHQWMLLRLLYEGKAGLDLAQSNPVLAYVLANCREFRAGEDTEITLLGRLCLKKQRDLAEWLGFPGTPAMVRLFQKIRPEAACPSRLRMFRSVIARGTFNKELGHLRQVNAEVLALVTNSNIADFVSPKLLEEVSERPDVPHTSDLLFETCAMFRTIRKVRWIRKPVCESVARLQAVHNELIPLYNNALAPPPEPAEPEEEEEEVARPRERLPRRRRERAVKPPEPPFPPPPFAGMDGIIPIAHPADLNREGREMHHCVATYKKDVQRSLMYVYRVLRPERATLALRRDTRGRWYPWQIKGIRNAEVSYETTAMVNRWFSERRTGQRELPR